MAFGLSGLPGRRGPLTMCKMLLIWWLLVFRGSRVPGPFTICKNAFDLVAFGLSGLPGRPGSPYYV